MNVLALFLTRLLAFFVRTDPRRTVAEGFGSATNPLLLGFDLSAGKFGDLR